MKRVVILDTFGPVPMNQAALIAGQAQLVTVGASDYEDGDIPVRPHFHCSSLCHFCFLPLTEAIPSGGCCQVVFIANLLDKDSEALYIYLMVTNRATITSVNLTTEDRKIICKLKRQFEPEHGKLTATGVIRIALRQAVR